MIMTKMRERDEKVVEDPEAERNSIIVNHLQSLMPLIKEGKKSSELCHSYWIIAQQGYSKMQKNIIMMLITYTYN